jgi:hypothetical protein
MRLSNVDIVLVGDALQGGIVRRAMLHHLGDGIVQRDDRVAADPLGVDSPRLFVSVSALSYIRSSMSESGARSCYHATMRINAVDILTCT